MKNRFSNLSLTEQEERKQGEIKTLINSRYVGVRGLVPKDNVELYGDYLMKDDAPASEGFPPGKQILFVQGNWKVVLNFTKG